MASSLVNNKYRITRRIGGGSFGEIYMGVGPNNEKVAVKFERHDTRCPQLRHEYKVYRELTGCHGFCQVYHFGQQDNYNVMVMDLLGPSLEDLFTKCNRRFSLKTVLQIADQMLERVDTMHARHLIHRDIKPANFVIGVADQASTIFCVDFGLSKRYRHPKNLQHIPHRDGRSLTGTPRYASINNHLGIEQSRRDDLESIGYVLIYFLKGSLPWQGLKAKNAQKKYRLIMEKKQQVSIAQLCQGCPSQFAEFLAYTRSLKFDAKPDIPYLRKLFRDLYHAQNCASNPKLWDWDGLENDYNSASGSNGAAPPVLAPAPAQPLGLRPTTAAAVASGAGAMDADLMGDRDDLDDDFDRAPGDRPTTAGAMLQYGARGATSNSNSNTWGYARQEVPSAGATGAAKGGSGIAELADGGANRRPHTAHGGRATAAAPAAGGFGGASGGAYPAGDPKAMSYGGEQDEHVVAGAREMMRYRRNRASTTDGPQPAAAQTAPQTTSAGYAGAPSATPWAYYQGAQKPATQTAVPSSAPSSSLPQQQQRTTTTAPAQSNGWAAGYGDRPKSATALAGSSANPGVVVSPLVGGAGSRPSSSTQPVANSSGAGQWGAQGAASNTLSYGSIKNRFLSGSTPSSGAPQQQSGSGTSKLFSLAR